ncbi:MAG: hypothetical protein ACYDBP_07235 [Leptospirales bacterium]
MGQSQEPETLNLRKNLVLVLWLRGLLLKNYLFSAISLVFVFFVVVGLENVPPPLRVGPKAVGPARENQPPTFPFPKKASCGVSNTIFLISFPKPNQV